MYYMNEMNPKNISYFLSNIFILSYAYLNVYNESGHIEDLERAYGLQTLGFDLAEENTLANRTESLGGFLSNPKNKVKGLLMSVLAMQTEGMLQDSDIFNAMRIIDVYHSSRLHLERISYEVNAQNWVKQKEIKNEFDFVNRKLDELSKGSDNAERDSLRGRSYELSLALL